MVQTSACQVRHFLFAHNILAISCGANSCSVHSAQLYATADYQESIQLWPNFSTLHECSFHATKMFCPGMLVWFKWFKIQQMTIFLITFVMTFYCLLSSVVPNSNTLWPELGSNSYDHKCHGVVYETENFRWPFLKMAILETVKTKHNNHTQRLRVKQQNGNGQTKKVRKETASYLGMMPRWVGGSVIPCMEKDFPHPVCPYAKMVPL